jgi:hypothetical protein
MPRDRQRHPSTRCIKEISLSTTVAMMSRIRPSTTRQNGPISLETRILNAASRTVDAVLSGPSEERVVTRGPFRCVNCFFSNFQQIYVPSEHIIAFTGYEQSDLSDTLHIPDFDRSPINAHCARLPLNSSFTSIHLPVRMVA